MDSTDPIASMNARAGRLQRFTSSSLFKPTFQRLREQLDQVQPFSLIALASGVGAITGGGAIVFAELIKLVQWLAIGSTDLPLHVLPHLPWYHVFLVPAVGGLLVAPFVFLVPHEARGHGVPEDRKSTRLNSSHLGISYA